MLQKNCLNIHVKQIYYCLYCLMTKRDQCLMGTMFLNVSLIHKQLCFKSRSVLNFHVKIFIMFQNYSVMPNILKTCCAKLHQNVQFCSIIIKKFRGACPGPPRLSQMLESAPPKQYMCATALNVYYLFLFRTCTSFVQSMNYDHSPILI